MPVITPVITHVHVQEVKQSVLPSSSSLPLSWTQKLPYLKIYAPELVVHVFATNLFKAGFSMLRIDQNSLQASQIVYFCWPL